MRNSVKVLLLLLGMVSGATRADSTYSLDVQMQLTAPSAVEGGARVSYVLSLDVPKVGTSIAKVKKGRLVVNLDASASLSGLSVLPSSARLWKCGVSGASVSCVNVRDIALGAKKRAKTTNVATVYGNAPNVSMTLLATASTRIGSGSPTFKDTVSTNNTVTASTAVMAVSELAPAAFNAFDTTTATGSITGRLSTRIAGTTIPVAVVAVSSGTKLNTGFSATVTVEALNAEDNSGSLDANDCRSSWSTVLSSVSGTLSGGRATFNLPAVKDVYRDVRIRVSASSGGTTVRGCSTDRFAIRPSAFVVSASDKDAGTAGSARALDNTGASGGTVHYAEAPFSLRVKAVTASGEAASRYPNVIQSVPELLVDSVLLPAGGEEGEVYASLAASGTSGELRADDATYSEVGAVVLAVVDDQFAQVDAADGNETAVTRISGTANLGRFVPESFQLDAVTAASLEVAAETGCAAANFAYLGQAASYASAPAWTITPLSAEGNPVNNYTGSLWKLSAAVPTTNCVAGSHTCSASAGSVQLAVRYASSTGVTPDLDAAATSFGKPTLTDNGDGTGTLTLAATDRFALNRPASPLAPFSLTYSLSVTLQDKSEGIAIGSSETVLPLPVGPSGFEFRFGQLKLINAFGAESISLPVRIEAQYWNGSGFTTNLADHCTRLQASDFSVSGFKGKLSGCAAGVSMAGSGRLSAGVGAVKVLAARLAGSLTLTANLSGAGGLSCPGNSGVAGNATSAARSWLLGKWGGASKYDRNPSAKVTFGIQHGADKVIEIREAF